MVSESIDNSKLIYEKSVRGRIAVKLPANDINKNYKPPDKLLRKSELKLPEVSQLEVIKHFTRLSQLNFSIDTNFYPLGSCTMKYNPKINEEIAMNSNFAELHPNQPEYQVQGALYLIHELQTVLGRITGLENVSLAPLAGAHGEYAGLLMARLYYNNKNQNWRTVALIPDSAHGTNPASAKMAGLDVVTIKTDEHGNTDIEDLKSKLNKHVCVFMLTFPSTFGLFEQRILEITDLIHKAGGLVYADGANLNALNGLVRLSDVGFDICHSNLHKTFSTPHGGGGPGAGPVMVTTALKDYLPAPIVIEKAGNYSLFSPNSTIGYLSGFHGTFGVMVRALAYIDAMGKDGLLSATKAAIVNANYIQESLKEKYKPAIPNRYCMHETVLTAQLQAQKGVRALDISKRLLDFEIHAPTMYFPTVVPEALMIEPTETETKESIDRFIEVMKQINQEVENSPELVKAAPFNTPVARLDEAMAARNPVLK